jgi:hypothetical protein
MEQNDAPCSNVLTVLRFGSNTNGNQRHLASVLRDLGAGPMGEFGCQVWVLLGEGPVVDE